MSNLNDEIRAAIETFDIDQARALLREAFKNNPDADTYYLASQVALNDDQKQKFLVKATEMDPFHSEAHAALGATVQNKPAELAAPAQQETAPATTTPPPEPPAEVNNARFVVAKVTTETSLKRYPWGDAPDRTTLPAGAVVIPMTRTESGTWLNVLYIGTTGREIVGWLERSAIEQPSIEGREVQIMDFPITEFEFNNKQDIVDFNKQLFEYYHKRNGGATAGISLGCFLCFFGLFGFIMDSTIGTILVLFGVTAVVIGIAHYKSQGPNRIAIHLGESWTGNNGVQTTWGKKLEAIRRSKQSDLENQMEHQARQFALNSAVHLGGIVLNRAVTNRQSVEVRHR